MAAECFTGGFDAGFGWMANSSFVEGGGFKHGIERVGIISLPGFVAGFDLKFAFLDSTCAVGVFAPKYVIGDGLEFFIGRGERDIL